MAFDPQSGDGFYRRLNPDLHFTGDPTIGIRVSSSAFKGPGKSNGRYANSVDWERLTPFEVEQVLRDELNPGRGIGRVEYFQIEALTESVSVEPDPVESNPGHCNAFATAAGARGLARALCVIEWGSSPIVTSDQPSVMRGAEQLCCANSLAGGNAPFCRVCQRVNRNRK